VTMGISMLARGLLDFPLSGLWWRQRLQEFEVTVRCSSRVPRALRAKCVRPAVNCNAL
jgi:hypothetical protein